MDEVFVTTGLIYNWRQKELGHLALKWAFLHYTDFKRRKYYNSFSSSIPSMQCCADVRATWRCADSLVL